VAAGVLGCLDGATAPRCERNAHLLGQKFSLDLVAQGAHRDGGRPDEGEVQARAELGEGDVFGDETPAHPHRVGFGFQQGAFEFGVVEVGDARRCLAERHGLVSLAYEHCAALGVGMKSDGRYAAPVLGIQFSYGPNQAHRGLTPIDHRDSTGKRDRRVGVKHSLSVCATTGAQRWNRRLCCRPVLKTEQVASAVTVDALSSPPGRPGISAQ
jgi:hypothetical protein